MNAAEALGLLLRIHDDIDHEVGPLVRRHTDRLHCARGCTQCCIDGLSVFEVEAERIRRRHGRLLRDGAPHPEGACAFLDEGGACRIYEDRPYVCRTQGLPLRWLEDGPEGTRVEMRDICPLNEVARESVESLRAGDCWTLGPFEGRLAQLQTRRGGEPPRRVLLRDLFGV